jgi:hypothetical protein
MIFRFKLSRMVKKYGDLSLCFKCLLERGGLIWFYEYTLSLVFCLEFFSNNFALFDVYVSPSMLGIHPQPSYYEDLALSSRIESTKPQGCVMITNITCCLLGLKAYTKLHHHSVEVALDKVPGDPYNDGQGE